MSVHRQINKKWSDTVVWYDWLLYCLLLLQGVTVQCLEYFIFVVEVEKSSVKDKAKIGLSVRLLGTLRYILSIIS
jgi:hypothetical protein